MCEPRFVVYTRADCSLCDVFVAELAEQLGPSRLSYEVRDVDADPASHRRFGLKIPVRCPQVPDNVLNPQATWEDPQAYELQARKLASLFRERFTRFAGLVSAEVLAAGPQP